MAKKIILKNQEYEVLQKVLEALPPAQLSRVLPNCTGADLYFYRGLLTAVLHKDFSFPNAD